jgi:PP-loop superfamily ATP-utilizing enzyme
LYSHVFVPENKKNEAVNNQSDNNKVNSVVNAQPEIKYKMNKKVILAFSGGLDTSYCAKYLSETLGYDVYAVTVNTGGFSKEEEKNWRKKL